MEETRRSKLSVPVVKLLCEPSNINKHYFTAAREAEMMASVCSDRRLNSLIGQTACSRTGCGNKPQTRTFVPSDLSVGC